MTSTQTKRALGGRQVGRIGLGCMNVSHAYGEPPAREDAEALIRTAFDRGVEHFDTAALYGFGKNEEVVGAALKPVRNQVFLASKCGLTGVNGKRVIDGRPETLNATIDESLRRLQTDVIDLYTLHRWDRKVPIEDSVGAMKDMVQAGKIRAIGLSEVSADTLRKAAAVHPIASVQTEYSLWTRNAEIAILDACRELGTAFVAFSPLGRGILTGKLPDPSTFAERDIRRPMPRFKEPNLSANRALVDKLAAIATRCETSLTQFALAWVLAKGEHIHIIPGTRNLGHLEENLSSDKIELPADAIAEADQLFTPEAIAGGRYADNVAAGVDTEDFPA